MKKILFILLLTPFTTTGQSLINSIIRFEGSGNGGRQLEFTEDTKNALLNNLCSTQTSYLFEKSPVEINIINEEALPIGEEFVFKTTPNQPYNWMLINITKQDTIFSDSSLEENEEQLINEWGLSVNFRNVLNPGDENSILNGFLGDSIIKDDSTSWLSYVEDNDIYEISDNEVEVHPVNWIRSGTDYVTYPTNSNDTIYIDMINADTWEDENSTYEGVLNGMWAPYRLVGYDKDDVAFPHSPSIGRAQKLDKLTSVDIVYTADKSLWTRVPVIETGDTITRMLLKDMPSVDKDGIDENNGSTGFSWFPGYAFDLERGIRVNIMFGEASNFPEHNGNDMVWNPSSTTLLDGDISNPANVVLGGRHYVYISMSEYAGDNEEDHPFYNRLTNMASFVNQKKVYENIAWVSIPLLSQNSTLLDGKIEIKLRVSKSYSEYNLNDDEECIASDENEGNLYLKFLTPACAYEEFTEYIPNWANYNSSMCQTLVVEGCTDSSAINYDVSANTNNGSCIPLIVGCMDTAAFNYIMIIEDTQVDVNTADGSCYPFIEGCIDEIAFNFIALTGNNQEDVNTDDGSCYPIIPGCMDISAFNYVAPTEDVQVDVNTSDGICTPVVEGCMLNWADNFISEANTHQNDLCFREGCMNYTATNYDSLATIDNSSCTIDGCTISIFPNYNPLATEDYSQSCDMTSQNIWGCNNEEACNYNLDANIDNGSCQVPELGFDCEYNFVGFELTVDFDDMNLDANSYWNGSDLSGAYIEEGFSFFNSYEDAWGSWAGFSISSVQDDSTGTWGNQYGVNTGMAYSGNNFAIATTGATVSFESNTINGFYITNSTYAAQSMLNGDAFAKQFGGESGNDEDWYLLSIIGLVDTLVTGTIEFYLADYRFGDNSQDYIINDWTWLDLTSLGNITSLQFNWSSSDNGVWGINTPAYFCMDDLITNNNNGCTDSTAFNFNPEAIYDNGTCTPFSYGCTDVNACNYNSQINSDDNSCVYSIDLNECATCSGEENGTGVIVENDIDNDGTCDGNEVDGCQDINALNYSVEATEEDNSCVYSSEIYNDLDSTVNVIHELLAIYQQALNTWNTNIDLGEGWNMFGYGCPSTIDVSEGLSNHTENIAIVKDNNGSVYMPEFGFNGIGDFTPGFGYQIKVMEAIEGFSLCDWYSIPTAENNYQTGDYIEGGIIFYIDETGQHGLVAAMEDLPNTNMWGCINVDVNGADGQLIGTGYQNTLDIIDCDGTPMAAITVANLSSNGFSDWYLPSIDELFKMHTQIGLYSGMGNITGFSETGYWSSTEYDFNYAWSVAFSTGNVNTTYKGQPYKVRPIRSF